MLPVQYRYVEAPVPDVSSDAQPCIFLAGGITGCPDWQAKVLGELWGEQVTIYNPRRKDFPIHDPSAAQQQIEWEHQHLKFADAIFFWFPCETLCPIVLYELGAWSMTDKPLFVGCHPDYKRKQDVVIQTGLVRPDVTVRDSVHATCQDMLSWLAVRTA